MAEIVSVNKKTQKSTLCCVQEAHLKHKEAHLKHN